MITVTAASGKLGRSLAQALEKTVEPNSIRLTARTPAKLDDLKRRGFDVAYADYGDAASLEAAFVDTDALMLISGEGPSELRIAHHRAAIDAAKRSGVKRIVYTSFTNAVRDSKFVWAHVHAMTEQYLKAAGLSWTILRDNHYASGLDGLLVAAKQSGVLAMAGATGKIAYVTHEDVAASAVAVLTGHGHESRTYELTGSEALDGSQIAMLVSQILKREVTAFDAPYDQAAIQLRSAGLPEFVVEALISLFHASAAGEYADVSGDVEKLTGRKPRSVREYIGSVLQ